jgi:MFS family permease
MVTSAGASSGRRAMVIASLVTVAGSLPVFFTAAMAVQVSADLNFGTVGIGSAVATFFGTMAVTSVYLGRVADRLGATRSLRLASIGAGTSAVGIATLAHAWWALAGWLIMSGTAAALAQPAANRLLINRVRMARLGTAFGLKQSAPPTASMLAGLSVPVIALTVGWRWAFAVAAVAAFTMAIAVGPPPVSAPAQVARKQRQKLQRLRDPGTLALLAVGFGLGFASNSAVLAFYVDAATRSGMSSSVAGLVFATASLAAIVVRVASGVACDRLTFQPLHLCAVLLTAGTVGVALLAVGEPRLLTVGGVLAIGGTWGFPGVFWFAVIRAYPQTPGRITGAMAPAAVGGVLGPIGFGVLAANVGDGAAWWATAAVALLAALAMLFGARRLISDARRLAVN